MNEWYEQAKSKLEAEKKAGSYDRYAADVVCGRFLSAGL